MFSVLRILLALTLIVIITSCGPPRSGIQFIVPIKTLEKLGFKDEFSIHNYTAMFGNERHWGKVEVWSQHATLYLTREEAQRIKDEVYLCIQFKEKWEPAWKGSYNLPIAYKSFFCNKANNSSKWECSGYETYHDKKQEIYKLLTKYD